MSDRDGPAYPIESVDRALRVILAFEDTESMTVTEAGRLLGVSRSTAFRLLGVLEHRGFVRQDKRTKVFHPGPALLRTGLRAVARSDVRLLLRPVLERVVAAVDETAHIVVLDNERAFYIDCVEGSKVLRATSRVGSSLPAHVSAAGKILLTRLPSDRVSQILSGQLVALTRRSKTSPVRIARELDQARKRGWAVNDGESEEFLRAIAVVVDTERSGASIDAAVTVAGPINRLTGARVNAVAATMLEIVDSLPAAAE